MDDFDRELNQFQDFEDRKLFEVFENRSVPLKIRKMALMQLAGLPTLNAEIKEADNLLEIFESVEKIVKKGESAILRFACIPDRLSVPSIYVNNDKELFDIPQKIANVREKYPEVKKIIVQEATNETDAKTKISGRLMITQSADSSEKIVELYKGSRSTGVFDHLDSGDRNYLRFEKGAGEFMKPLKGLSPDTDFVENEVRAVFIALQDYDKAIRRVIRIYNKVNKGANNGALPPIVFEFSIRDGKFNFVDVD